MLNSKKVILALCCILILTITACSNLSLITEKGNSTSIAKHNGESAKSYEKFNKINHGTFAPSANGMYSVQTIFPFSSNILYTDYSLDEQIFLCPKPECNHDHKACPSYIEMKDIFPPMLVTTDKYILLIQAAASKNSYANIEVCDLSGGNRRTIVTLKHNQSMGSNFVSDNRYLVFEMREILVDTTEQRFLMCLDLETGSLGKICSLISNQGFTYSLENSTDSGLVLFAMKVDKQTAIARYSILDPSHPILDDIVYEYDPFVEFALCDNNSIFILNNKACTITKKDLTNGSTKTFNYTPNPGSIKSSLAPAFDSMVFLLESLPVNKNQIEFSRSLINFENNTETSVKLNTNYNNRPVTIATEHKDSLYVIVDFKEHNTQVINDKGNVENISFITDVFASIEKRDFIRSIPNYRTINSTSLPEA